MCNILFSISDINIIFTLRDFYFLGDSLSSNNADHANSYLLSAKPIFHMVCMKIY